MVDHSPSADPGPPSGTPGTRPLTASVAILTYRRPDSLLRTLESLRQLPAAPLIDEVVVIDNDREPSAREAVTRLASGGYPHPVRYVHEATPGLAAARNRALDEAEARVLVFIDDDEVAAGDWPGGLLDTMTRTGAGLVGGPVRTVFTDPPPAWVVEGGFFDRAEPADGSSQTWLRSGNLAIDLDAVRPTGVRFDPAFGLSGGEDVAFSRAARRAGIDLRWSASAVVEEAVGPERATLGWLARRELTSTTNWVRVERSLDRSRRRVALITARGLARVAQGVATAGVGVVTLDSVKRSRGVVIAARGAGAFRGLAARVPETYRMGDDARP